MTASSLPATAAEAPTENAQPSKVGLVVASLVGGAVSISLGVYGRVHSPTFEGIYDFGFGAVLPMKAWFTTGAAVLVIFQITSAAWMYGRLPGVPAFPGWVGQAHRWSGTAAFLLTLPVAYHCLWSLGFQSGDTRVLVHSILGCAFYGIFTTKMLCLHSSRVSSSALPLFGSAAAVVLTGIWLTSSLWFFQNFGFPGV